MALRYFIYKGIQFRTIDLPAATVGLAGDSNVACTVLEDVVQGALDTGAFTPLLGSGDDTVLKMNALRGYWSDRQGGINEVRRTVLNATAPMLDPNPSDADDTSQSPTQYNVHRLAHRYILPPGLDQLIQVPDTGNYFTAGRRLIYIQNLIFDHTNLEKHATPTLAWRAFTNYWLTFGLGDEIAAATEDYFLDTTLNTTA